METFKIHLIRHGVTQGNLNRTYVGTGIDMPLCDIGVEELRLLYGRYKYPKTDIVFVSPMSRTKQTADILFPTSKQIVLEDLREAGFGEYEGKTVAELSKDEKFASRLSFDSDFTPTGGESGKDFVERCTLALSHMFRYIIERQNSEAACVTHGGVIMAMLSRMAFPKKTASMWMTDNGCGYTATTTAGLLMRNGICKVQNVVPFGYGENS